jgi:hypothetical protein
MRVAHFVSSYQGLTKLQFFQETRWLFVDFKCHFRGLQSRLRQIHQQIPIQLLQFDPPRPCLSVLHPGANPFLELYIARELVIALQNIQQLLENLEALLEPFFLGLFVLRHF